MKLALRCMSILTVATLVLSHAAAQRNATTVVRQSTDEEGTVWNASVRVIPPDEGSDREITLRCTRTGSIQDRQTRAGIIRRRGMTQHAQSIGDLIQAMDDAGYEKSGEPGNEVLTVTLPYEVIFEKRIRFSATAGSSAIVVTTSAKPGEGRLEVNDNIRQYLTPENVARLNREFAEHRSAILKEMQPIKETWMQRVFPLTEEESRAARTYRKGEVPRRETIHFCGKEYIVVVEATWNNPFPELGQ